jgi:hypothetical protein
MSRMNAESLEQAQSRMRLENQTQAKAEVAAERFGPTSITSDLMNVDETAQYLRISKTQLFQLTRARAQHPIPAIKYGKRVTFRPGSIDKWLAALEKMAG